MKNLLLVLLGMILGAGITITLGAILIASAIQPFHLELQDLPTIIWNMQEPTQTDNTSQSTTEEPQVFTEQSINLSPTQIQTLQNYGIDPATIPSTLSAEQMACLTTQLGATRVQEILGGADFTMTDLFKAQRCL